MPGLHAHIDPEGLEEFSVVFTDRSLNHMSARFQGVMRDVSGMLKEVYKGSAVALVPMSKMNGPVAPPGMPMQMGLVPSRGRLPPTGATRGAAP